LNIANNASLATITGLNKLGHLGGSLIVRDSDVLTQFDSIASLVAIGLDLVVVSNPKLGSLAGLRSGTLKTNSLGNIYLVAGNPLLSVCEVNDLVTTLGVTTNDQSGANSGCAACSGGTCGSGAGGIEGQRGIFTGDATIAGTADVAWMANVQELTGSLHVDSTALTNLTGLENLQSVQGNVTITNNASLTNINGLSGLESVGGYISLQSNGVLSNVNGLAALTTVGSYFQIYGNSQLLDLDGLANLASVAGYFNIQSNAVLTNLDGLANLTTVGTASSDYLQIYGNAALASMTGLISPTGKLANMAGTLTVSYNTKLNSCQPDALKTVLTAGGWTKTYSQTGNLTCATSCSGTVCQ
jgi:hypothetical protein